jgi:hypothetical protein
MLSCGPITFRYFLEFAWNKLKNHEKYYTKRLDVIHTILCDCKLTILQANKIGNRFALPYFNLMLLFFYVTNAEGGTQRQEKTS